MKHGLIVAMEASAQNASAGLKDFDRGTSPGKSMPRKVVIRESYRRVSATFRVLGHLARGVMIPGPRPPSVRMPVVATPFGGNDRTASSGTSSVMVRGFQIS